MTISMGAYGVLREHTWPGNIRELQNVVRAACIQAKAEGETSLVRDLVERALFERRIGAHVPHEPRRGEPRPENHCEPWPFHFITPEGLIPENEIIPRFRSKDPRKGPKAKALQRAVAEFKRFVITRHLEQHDGNRFRVARELEENLPTLLHMMNSLGMSAGGEVLPQSEGRSDGADDTDELEP